MFIDIDQFINIVTHEVTQYQYKVPVVDLISVQNGSPFKILISAILSARTKDETTASASQRLFKVAPDPKALSKLSQKKIQDLIFPVGFYRMKAEYLTKIPKALEAFEGKVPDNFEALISLPGVGRKTANLVMATAFEKNAICVDTHVHRIMNIWGYVKTKTPFETETELRKKLPLKFWKKINRILVAFGQVTCRSMFPVCDECILTKICPKIGVTPRKNKAKPIISIVSD